MSQTLTQGRPDFGSPRRRRPALRRLVAVGALTAGVIALVPPVAAAARPARIVGTASTTTGPITIWPSSATPAVLADADTAAVELGVKFKSDVDGTISALRYYKSSANTGTHTAKLWSSGGTLLASATFTNETASGWQQVGLPAPVPVGAGKVYVASYHAPFGRYSATSGYFSGKGADNGPLH